MKKICLYSMAGGQCYYRTKMNSLVSISLMGNAELDAEGGLGRIRLHGSL